MEQPGDYIVIGESHAPTFEAIGRSNHRILAQVEAYSRITRSKTPSAVVVLQQLGSTKW